MHASITEFKVRKFISINKYKTNECYIQTMYSPKSLIICHTLLTIM